MSGQSRWMVRSVTLSLLVVLFASTGCVIGNAPATTPSPSPSPTTSGAASPTSQPSTDPLTGSVTGSFVPTGTLAGDAMPRLTIGAAKAKQGEKATVPVTFETSVPVEVLSFAVFFHRCHLASAVVKPAEGFSGQLEAVPDATLPSRVRITVRPEKALLGKLNLASIKFDVTGLPGMTTILQVEDVRAAKTAKDPLLPMSIDEGRIDIAAADGSTGGPAFIGDSARIVASGGSLKPNYVEVKIELDTEEELGCVQYSIQFDTTVLAMDELHPGPVIANTLLETNFTKPGDVVQGNVGFVKLGAISINALPKKGTIATIKFQVKSGKVGSETALRFQSAVMGVSRIFEGRPNDQQGGKVPCRMTDAVVRITQ